MSAFICSPEHIAAIATASPDKVLSVYIPEEGWRKFTPAEAAYDELYLLAGTYRLNKKALRKYK